MWTQDLEDHISDSVAKSIQELTGLSPKKSHHAYFGHDVLDFSEYADLVLSIRAFYDNNWEYQIIVRCAAYSQSQNFEMVSPQSLHPVHLLLKMVQFLLNSSYYPSIFKKSKSTYRSVASLTVKTDKMTLMFTERLCHIYLHEQPVVLRRTIDARNNASRADHK